MSINIVDSIVGQLSKDQVDTLARTTGQDPAVARGTLATGVTTIVGHLVTRGSTTTGAHNLLTTLRSSGGSSSIVSGLVGDSSGDDLADAVSRSTGIRRTAATGMVSMLLPLVASFLRREVMTRGLDAGGLMNMLRSVKGGIPDIGTHDPRIAVARHDVRTDLPDIHEVKTPIAREDVRVREVPVEKHVEGKGRSWLPALLAFGAVALLGLILWGRNRPETSVVDTRSDTTITGAEVARDRGIASHFANKDVPDAIPLSDVNFATGTTTIVAGAAAIDELASMMKQHPTTRVRLEGHTDSTGDAKVNETLSMERAMTIKKMLVEKGVDASRIDAAGRRDAKPAAGNETEQGRAMNRRVDAVIIKR